MISANDFEIGWKGVINRDRVDWNKLCVYSSYKPLLIRVSYVLTLDVFGQLTILMITLHRLRQPVLA